MASTSIHHRKHYHFPVTELSHGIQCLIIACFLFNVKTLRCTRIFIHQNLIIAWIFKYSLSILIFMIGRGITARVMPEEQQDYSMVYQSYGNASYGNATYYQYADYESSGNQVEPVRSSAQSPFEYVFFPVG